MFSTLQPEQIDLNRSNARGVEGLAAKTFLVNEIEYPYASILVNSDYHVEFDDKGFPMEFSRLTSASK